MGLDLGFQRVVIVGDARLVIRKLRIEQEDRPAISAFIKDSKELSKRFDRCNFEHASRQANGLAHLRATEGIRRGENTYLEGGIPGFGVDEAECDRRW